MTREELKAHCERQIEMCETRAYGKGEKPSGKVYEEHKLILELLEQTKWILCSEKMPTEHEWMGTKRFGTTISDEVYVTLETPDGERFTKHLSFQNG